MLFVPQNMVVPQQALLKQAGVQVLAFEANSLRALTQRVRQTAAVLGAMRSKKRSPINATSIATWPWSPGA